MDPLLTIGQYAAAIAAIVGAVTLLINILIIKPLKALDSTIADKVETHITKSIKELETTMTELTKQIQPNTNGGKSLPDVHKRIDKIEQTQEQILEILTTPKKRGRPPKSE
jgi:hypothetical protein